jgi:hypothetical protein
MSPHAIMSDGSQSTRSVHASQLPDRRVWSDRKWEWLDEHSNKVSNASDMFRRSAERGVLHFVITCDQAGDWLDGGKTLKLGLPQPVPARRFWSITVFDTVEHAWEEFDPDKAARRSRFELKNNAASSSLDLFFGPQPPPGRERDWIETNRGTRWLAHLCIYGPEAAAFDGSWRPGDLEQIDLEHTRKSNRR